MERHELEPEYDALPPEVEADEIEASPLVTPTLEALQAAENEDEIDRLTEAYLRAHPPDAEYDDDPTEAEAAALEASLGGPFHQGPPAAAEIVVEIPDILRGPASYISGPAGTGKTTMARGMVSQLKGTVLAATTGIAAVNLGEGTTINALLGYFDTQSLKDSWTSGHLNAKLGKLWRAGVRRILLDEVSMMDGDQLTVIHRALRELSGDSYGLDADLSEEMHAAPEGEKGIDLTLIGDFAQLPPVKAPFAFESPEWHHYGEHTHKLTKIWRQDAVAFVEALMALRRGQASGAVPFFRQRLQRSLDQKFDGSTIVATNEAVDRFNSLRMDQLGGPVALYQSTRWGTERGDWKNIPPRFGLKKGALVMILANLREMGLDGRPGALIYANGDLGEVEDMAAGVAPNCTITVKLRRNGRIVSVDPVTRQNTVPLETGEKKKLKEAGHEDRITEDGKSKVIGEVTYMPVRVAYATTVHKSQGLSLDKVQIDTTQGFFKSPGMLYVAFSRARTAEGLYLVGTPEGLAQRCTVNQKVVPWV